MQFSQSERAGTNLIEAYGNGGFRVAGQALTGHLLVSATLITAWQVAGIETAQMASLNPLFEGDTKPEILLFGCGACIIQLPAELRGALEVQGIGYDLMDTGAAARTFNLLLLEGRQVAAVLIAVI